MSITKEEIIATAESRGFTLWSTETLGDHTKYHFMDERGINLWVDCENNFSLGYLVPKSVFTFNCADCSPFTDKAHFEKIYRPFKHEVIECWSHLTRGFKQ